MAGVVRPELDRSGRHRPQHHARGEQHDGEQRDEQSLV
jgi:hypothetical protein